MAVALDPLDGGSERVLVCHSERHIVKLLQVNLERQGHTVVCVFEGQEALELLESAELLELPHFDKVILDSNIPKVGGYEVLKWIRTHERARDAWVALIIRHDLDREIWERQPHRPDIYFTVPFSPSDIFR